MLRRFGPSFGPRLAKSLFGFRENFDLEALATKATLVSRCPPPPPWGSSLALRQEEKEGLGSVLLPFFGHAKPCFDCENV